jgi:hypothetical protein
MYIPHTYLHTHISAKTPTHTYTHIHACAARVTIHVFVRTYIQHTYIHTHTHTQGRREVFDQIDINEKINAGLPAKLAEVKEAQETVAQQNKQISALRYQAEQLKISCTMMDKKHRMERKFQEEGGYFVEPLLEECEQVSGSCTESVCVLCFCLCVVLYVLDACQFRSRDLPPIVQFHAPRMQQSFAPIISANNMASKLPCLEALFLCLSLYMHVYE